MDKKKILEYLESMVNDEPEKGWSDYDQGMYEGEQFTINGIIQAIKEGRFDN